MAEAQIQKCHERCVKCHLFDYNLEWHCLECAPGYELWVDGCFAPCGAGAYRNGYHCEDCTVNCDQCTGPLRHECVTCAADYAFDFRGLCVRVCQTGEYPTPDGVDCTGCNPYCRTCMSGTEIGCTSCFSGFVKRVIDPNTEAGECMQTCRMGFFRDASDDLRCIQCPEYCLDCESFDMCFQCEVTATLFRGICYPTPLTAVEDTVTFATYLASGAGIQWDPEDAPGWAELQTAVRSEERAAEEG